MVGVVYIRLVLVTVGSQAMDQVNDNENVVFNVHSITLLDLPYLLNIWLFLP